MKYWKDKIQQHHCGQEPEKRTSTLLKELNEEDLSNDICIFSLYKCIHQYKEYKWQIDCHNTIVNKFLVADFF